MSSEDQQKLELLEAALLLNNKDPYKWFWLARQQRKMSRLVDARKSYGRALTLDPKLADAHYELGLLESTEGHEAAAEAAFAQAIESNPKHFGALDELARRREQASHWEAALPHLLAMVGSRPDDVPARRRAGAANMALGRYGAAAEHLERAVEKATHDPALRGELGRCYVEQGLWQAAKDCLTQVPIEALDEPALLALAKALLELGELADASACYQALLARSPSQTDGLVGLGRTRLLERAFEPARAVLARALEQDGTRAELHALHAESLQGLGRYTEALDAANRGIALEPGSARCHEDAGLALNALRRFDEAVSAFQRALRYDAQRLHASVGLAEAHEQLNQGERAVAALEGALAVKPDDPALHLRLANLLYRLGHTARALASYRDATRLDPTLATAYRGVGQCAVELESYEEAVAALTQAIELAAEDAVALRLLGRAERALGRPARAAESFERATRVEANDARTWHDLGACLLEAQKLGPAHDALRRARALDATEATERLLADALLRMSRFEEALPVLERLVKLAPEDGPLWRDLGRTHQQLGQHAAARDALGRAAKLRRTEAGYSLEYGLAALRLEEFEVAAAALELAHQLEPNDAAAAVALGQAYNGLGRFADAVSVLSSAVARDPALLDGQRALGEALARLERLPEAKTCFERAVGLADQDGRAHHALGEVLLRTGAFSQAVVHLKRATLLTPERTEALRSLARAHRRLGNDQDALTSYRQLLRLLPEDVDALLELAQTNEALERDEEALTLLEQANALRPDPGTQLRVGLLQAKLGRDRAAAATLEGVLSDDPSHFAAYGVLAASHRKLRNLEEELQALERAALLAEKAASRDASSYYQKLGLALADASRETPAIAALTRAVELGDGTTETTLRLAALHRSAGTRALSANDAATAAEHLERALKAPSDAEPYRLLAAAYLKLGRSGEAVTALQKGMQSFPKEFALPSFLGRTQLELGAHGEALEAFERALSLKPDAFDELWGAALAAEALGRRKDAIAFLVRAEAQRPASAEVAEHLGRHYYEEGRFSDALTAWNKVLELRPLDAEASYGAGLCQRELGDDVAAAASFERATAQGSGSARAQFELGSCRVRLGELERAVDALREAAALDPKHDGAQALLGRCLAQLQKDAEAVSVLGAYLEARFDNELALERARCLSRLERWLELERAADALLKAAPGHGEALQLRALALESQGRTDEALAALRIAVSEGKDPGAKGPLKKLLVERAQASSATQNPLAAAAAYAEALSLTPKDPELHLNHALSLRAAGQVQRALDATRAGLEVDPRRTELWVLSAQLLESGGVLEESVQSYRRALELAPEHEAALLGVARVYERQGELEQASQALLRASQLAEPRVALERRAAVLERLGQGEELARVWSRLRELGALDADGLRRSARLNVELGHHDDVVVCAQAALQTLPDDAECLYWIGSSEHALGRHDHALAPLTRLTEKHPEHPGAWALLARVLLALQRWDRALEALERALSSEPEDVELWQGLVTTCEQLDRKSDRARALAHWVKLAPSAALQRELALLLDELGDARADAELETAVRELPDDDELARRLASLLLTRAEASAGEARLSLARRAVPHAQKDAKLCTRAAWLLRAEGRVDEALAVADRALELAPDDVSTLILHGQLRLENQLPEGALVSFRRAVELKADALLALEGSGRASLALKKHDDAELALRRATTIQPENAELWQLLSQALEGQGKKNEACDAQRHVVRLKQDDGDARVRLARLSMSAERFGESVELLAPMWKAGGASTEVALLLGQSLAEVDRMQEAADVTEQALGSEPSATHTSGALWAVRARALSELDRPDDAIAAFERALELGVEGVRAPLAETLRRRAATLARSDATRSAALYDRALALTPRDGSTLLALARSRRDAGELQSALDAAREALAVDPSLTAAELLLAQLEAGLGRHEPALAAFERVLASEPGSREAWLGKGLSQVELKSPAATASLERSVELGPSKEALEALLALDRAQGDEARMLLDLDRLARLGPLSSERASELGRLRLAHDRAEEASELLDEALGRDATHGGLLLQKARAALALEAFERASSALESLLQVEPTHELANGLLGRALGGLGRHPEAAEAFQRQVERTPTAECLEELADALGRSGDEARRVEVLARLSRARHDDEQGLLRVARAHAERGRLDDAIGVLERALELAPEAAAIGNLLGRQLLAKATQERDARDAQRALQHLARAERLPPDRENLPQLVELYVALGELAAATRVANTWVELEPQNPAASTQAGQVRRLAKDEAQALQHFERALRLDGDHLPALRGAGLALEALGRPLAAAEMLLRAVRIDAKETKVNQAALDCSARVDDLEKAEQLLRELCALLPRDARVKRELAQVLGRRGSTSEALELVDEGLELAASDHDAWTLKAELLLRLGRAEEARRAAERALALSPGKAPALRALGLAHAQSGETQDALEPLEKAYRENPNPELAERLARLYTEAGVAQAARGAHELGVASLRRALELGSKDSAARLALGKSLLTLGQLQGAIDALNDELELTREYIPGWLTLGEAFSRANQWSRAADAFDVILELEPESFEALRGRARVAAQLEDDDRARRLFEQALELRPDASDLRREVIRWYEGQQEPDRVLAHLELLGPLESLEDDELRRLGVLLCRARRDLEAERVLERALAQGLGDVATLDALSEVQARIEPKRALSAAQRLVELEPSHVQGFLRLARAQRAAGDEAAAAHAYERAIQLEPSKESMAELAALHGASAQAEGRIETLRRLVERYPDDAEHTAALGLELAREGRPDAAQVLERALALGSARSEARVALFELVLAEGCRLADAGQHREALEHARRAAQLLPAHTGPGLLTASVHRADRRDDLAIEALRAVLALDGEACAALIQLGAIETERGEYQAAIPRLRRAAELDKTDTEALRRLADAEVGLHRPAAAIQALDRLLERNPSDLPAQRDLIRLSTASGQHARALELCQRALEQAPDDVPLRLDRARAYQAMQRGENAVATVDEVLTLEPDNLVALRLRRDLLREMPANDRLAAALQALFSVEKSRETLLELEQCGQKLARLDLRLWALHELVALNGTDAAASARLGEALHEKGHTGDAIRQLERAVALDPKAAWIRDALVRLCWAQGREKAAEHDPRSAAEYLEKAAAHAPSNGELAFEYAYALVQAKHGKANETMRNALRTAVANGAKALPLLPRIGAALFDMQDYAAAAQAYHQACQLEPQQLEHQRSLISALLHGGQRAEAVEWLRHAVRLAPRDESLLYSLGVQYALLGRMNEVRDVWNALSPLNPQLAQQLIAQSQARK